MHSQERALIRKGMCTLRIAFMLGTAALAAPYPALAGGRRAAVRIPAEWETHAATWMQWPYGWEQGYRKNFADIIDALQSYESVNIIVTGDSAKSAAISYLTAQGVPLANISWHIADYDNAWMRDNGPVWAMGAGGLFIQDWGFNGWGDPTIDYTRDDAIPRIVAGWLGLHYDTYSLINERGTLEFNGVDTLITSWAVLHSRNPSVPQPEMEQALKDAFGVTRVVWLTKAPSDDMTGGHVDGIARFISGNTVAVARSLIPGDADAGVYDDAATVIAAAGFNVVRLDIPGTITYGTPQLVMAADYMNWLVANGVVVMTGFDMPAWDEAARLTVAGFFPGREVIVVDTRELWYNGGGVHCVTNDEPAVSADPTPTPTETPPGGDTPTPTKTPMIDTPSPTVTPEAPTATPGGPTATPAPPTETPNPPTPVPPAQIALNGASFGAGSRFTATFTLNETVTRTFIAYAVINLPDGSMLDAMTLSPRIVPVATNVNGLSAGFSYPLMSLTIPPGAPKGNCSVMAGFFDPGRPITGPSCAFLLATTPFTLH